MSEQINQFPSELNTTGEIGETLSQQVPGRSEIAPNKDLELDREFAESGQSNLSVDFEKILATLSELEVKKKESTENEDFDQILNQLKEKRQIDQVFGNIVRRISSETNLMRDFDEVDQIVKSVFESGNGSEIFGIEYKPAIVPDMAMANADPSKKLITVYHDQPSKEDYLKSFVLEGLPPVVSGIVLHERIHNLQYERDITGLKSLLPKGLGWLSPLLYQLKEGWEVTKGSKGQELIEAHATKTGTFPYADNVDMINNMAEIPAYQANIDKLISAFHRIDQLMALGFSQNEILDAVARSGKWSKEKFDFPQLHKIILEKGEQLNLSEDDIDNLAIARNLEKEIQRLKALLIAREEIEHAVSSK